MGEKKKYTMLVVDDEPYISDGLKRLFEETFGSMFQVVNCYHPKKALEIFKFRLPEVVVSDVRMPKMTGIEMAMEMRKIKPDIHVLFLSGYDEFDYVYSAIQQDADAYVLKAEGDNLIVEAMKKMIGLMDSQNTLMEEFETAKSRVSYMSPAFKHNAMLRILDGDITSQEEFDRLMADMENPLPAEGKMLMLLGFTKEKAARAVREQVLELVSQTLQKAYGGKIGYIHTVIYRKTFVWLLETEEKELQELLCATLSDAQELVQTKLSLAMAFGIAKERVKWTELVLEYTNLFTQMQRHLPGEEDYILLEDKEITISDSFGGEEVDFEQMMIPLSEKIQMMQSYLEGEDKEAFEKELEEVLKILSKARRHSMYALELYNSITNVLVGFINKRNIRLQLASKIQLMELFDPGAFVTWEQAADYIRKLCAAIEETCVFSGQKTFTGIADRIKSYVLSNLGRDLSLAAIGEEMGFNPIYLSRVFKQEEGCSIREYIENRRMDMAKRMLMNSNLKILDVGAKCGYPNTAYFIKIFKSHFQVTPQEYRDKESIKN